MNVFFLFFVCFRPFNRRILQRSLISLNVHTHASARAKHKGMLSCKGQISKKFARESDTAMPLPLRAPAGSGPPARLQCNLAIASWFSWCFLLFICFFVFLFRLFLYFSLPLFFLGLSLYLSACLAEADTEATLTDTQTRTDTHDHVQTQIQIKT